MLADGAAALDGAPAALAGTPVPAADRAAVAAHARVRGIRQALADIDPGEPPGRTARSLAELGDQLTLVDELRQACDYAGAAGLLPELLRDLNAAGRPALPMLCDAAFIASSVLRNLGYPAEAWLGAERCRAAADAAQDPTLQGYAEYARACAATVCGSYERALALAERAVDELSRHRSGPGAREVLGSLQLICAQSARATRRPDDSRAWVAEAAELARGTGETTTMGLYFGPTNVAIWRIGIEVDGDDPGRAAEVARGTDPAALPVGFRQVFYYADTARALARLRGRDREAIRFLLVAERIAPQHVHTSAMVQETTRMLLERSRRAAGGAELRGLCARMRVA
jgi:hypothetical protein